MSLPDLVVTGPDPTPPRTDGLEEMRLWVLLGEFAPGDDWSWTEEFEFLRTDHKVRMARLKKKIEVEGILEPILLGNDGRVWDGHHRLCVAAELGLNNVPVARAP